YTSPSASAPRRAVAERTVQVGNRTWTITAWAGPGAVPVRPPWWGIALAAAALLAGLAGVAAVLRRGDRASRARETARAEEVRLISDAGPLLQQSLDLGELLPDFAVRLAQQFDLDRLGVAVANEQGELVDTFSIGPAPGAGRPLVEIRPNTTHLEPGEDFVILLQRTGRTVGTLRGRSRRALEQAQMS